MPHIPKPEPGEYAPYTIMYISLLPDDGQVLRHLRKNLDETLAFIRTFPAEKLTTPCAPGEWTIQEILIHITDTERIFAYRALRIARGDTTPLPGFEQDDYVPNSGANARTPASIVDEFEAVREATIHLFKNFSDNMWERRGTASNAEVTVTALAFITAGHWEHHLRVIRERYLS